jgi:hypothetical protein
VSEDLGKSLSDTKYHYSRIMPQERNPNEKASLQPEFAEKFLAITQKQLEVQAKQVELQDKVDARNYEYAKELLKTQLEDRKDERLHEQKKIVYQGILLGVVVIGIFATTAHLATNGQKEVAIEIIKYVAPLAAGGLGGYGLGYAKGQKSKETQKDTSS